MADLVEQVEYIVKYLEGGYLNDLNDEGEQVSAWDYVADSLDIEYVVSQSGEYKGARLLVAFGGPNIWIDTQRCVVEGFWWSDYWKEQYVDEIGIDDVCKEMWECTGL